MSDKHQQYAVCINVSGELLRNFERTPRKHGGKIEYVEHKYAIKDGLTIFEARILNMQLRIKELIGVDLYANRNP